MAPTITQVATSIWNKQKNCFIILYFEKFQMEIYCGGAQSDPKKRITFSQHTYNLCYVVAKIVFDYFHFDASKFMVYLFCFCFACTKHVLRLWPSYADVPRKLFLLSSWLRSDVTSLVEIWIDFKDYWHQWFLSCIKHILKTFEPLTSSKKWILFLWDVLLTHIQNQNYHINANHDVTWRGRSFPVDCLFLSCFVNTAVGYNTIIINIRRTTSYM